MISMLEDFHRTIVRQAFNMQYRKSVLLHSVAELERSQWLAREELLELQWRKVQELLASAYQHVDYYRRIMQERGLSPGDFQAPADLAKLPLLTKDLIRENLSSLLADGFNPSRLKHTNTGGFTGRPATLYHDRRMVESYRAAKVRQFRWCGWEIGDMWVKIWGSVADTGGLKARAFNTLARVRVLPAFSLNDATMASYVSQLRHLQPPLIEAYATPLYVLARYMREHGINDIRPRGIISSAEPLYAHHRETVEAAFGCRVFDRYGCREVGDIAQECDLGVKHINAENLFVEFLADGRPAAAGENAHIVVTALNSQAMPLIRYQVGDVGSWTSTDCECGRGLPTMANTVGRAGEGIVLRDNRVLPREYFPDVFKKFPIDKFQVIQIREDQLHIRLVPGQKLTSGDVACFQQEIGDFLAGEAEVQYEYVGDIALSHSGKFRYTISQRQFPPDGATGDL